MPRARPPRFDISRVVGKRAHGLMRGSWVRRVESDFSWKSGDCLQVLLFVPLIAVSVGISCCFLGVLLLVLPLVLFLVQGSSVLERQEYIDAHGQREPDGDDAEQTPIKRSVLYDELRPHPQNGCGKHKGGTTVETGHSRPVELVAVVFPKFVERVLMFPFLADEVLVELDSLHHVPRDSLLNIVEKKGQLLLFRDVLVLALAVDCGVWCLRSSSTTSCGGNSFGWPFPNSLHGLEDLLLRVSQRFSCGGGGGGEKRRRRGKHRVRVIGVVKSKSAKKRKLLATAQQSTSNQAHKSAPKIENGSSKSILLSFSLFSETLVPCQSSPSKSRKRRRVGTHQSTLRAGP